MPSYSGLWNNEYGENHSLITNRTGNPLTSLARTFANRLYGRAAQRELIHALTGAAAGETASASHKRVTAVVDRSENVQGGVRAIETKSHVNRATVAGDATAIKNAIRQSSKPTYPVDRAGNGGGAKLGW